MTFITTKNAQYAFHNRDWVNHRKEQLNKLLVGVAIKTLRNIDVELSTLQIKDLQEELKLLERGEV